MNKLHYLIGFHCVNIIIQKNYEWNVAIKIVNKIFAQKITKL